MNCSAYIFGNFELGYSQYPDDFTNTIFHSEQFKPQAKTQIAIHKDGNLIYYAYYRSLDNGNNQYIGLSIVFNGVFCKNIEKLFNLFEDAITSMVVSGKIIEFTETGSVTTKTTKLYLEKTEIDRIVQALTLSVNQIASSDFAQLPPINLGVGMNEVAFVSSDNFFKQCVNILTTNNRILILKDKDYDSAQMSGYARKLKTLYNEKKKLIEENQEIRKLNEQLNKQKKQITKVVILVIALLACVIGLLLYKDNVQRLNAEIEENEITIDNLSETIRCKNYSLDSLQRIANNRYYTIKLLESDVRNLQESVNGLEDAIERKNNSLDSLSDVFSGFKSTMTNSYPIVISDIKIANSTYDGEVQTDYGQTIYSHNTMYLTPKIYYSGLKSGYVTLKVKWYTIIDDANLKISRGDSSPADFSQSKSYYISTGDNSLIMYGWGSETKGNWSSGKYRIEVWYEDVCLKTKTFTIY